MVSKRGFCRENGIYYSKREPIPLPSPHQHLDLTTYVLARDHNTDIAFIDAPTGASLTYTALHHNVKALAAGLHRLGIRKRDVVLVISPNSIHIPYIYLAILSIGAILTTTNPLNTEAEILKQVKDSNPVIAFTVPEFFHKARATQLPVVVIQTTTPTPEQQEGGCVSTLNNLLQSRIHDLPSIDIKQEDTATLLYSSGTTGKPKGVVATHRNHISMVAMSLDIWGKNNNGIHEKNDVFLCIMPLFHIYGFYRTMCSVAAGDSMVMVSKFELAQMLWSIERHRVTTVPAAPPIFVALTKSGIAAEYDLSSLQMISCAGAPLGKDLIDDFVARFPNVDVTQGYGMTESCGGVTFTSIVKEKKKYGMIGSLIANMEAKIVDTISGKALAQNQQGELWLRGPSIMKGYIGNVEATATTLDSEGWLKTGDLCYIDEEGFLFFVDRIKELIKYKAFQVAPAELEEILLSNPEIADAAVIPYPHKESGQIPMAFIVRKSDSNLNEEDVMSFISKQVAPYKKIRRVAFVTSIPKNPSGKILRKDLVRQALSASKL